MRFTHLTKAKKRCLIFSLFTGAIGLQVSTSIQSRRDDVRCAGAISLQVLTNIQCYRDDFRCVEMAGFFAKFVPAVTMGNDLGLKLRQYTIRDPKFESSIEDTLDLTVLMNFSIPIHSNEPAQVTWFLPRGSLEYTNGLSAERKTVNAGRIDASKTKSLQDKPSLIASQKAKDVESSKHITHFEDPSTCPARETPKYSELTCATYRYMDHISSVSMNGPPTLATKTAKNESGTFFPRMRV